MAKMRCYGCRRWHGQAAMGYYWAGRYRPIMMAQPLCSAACIYDFHRRHPRGAVAMLHGMYTGVEAGTLRDKVKQGDI